VPRSGLERGLLEILCFQSLATAAHHVAPLDSPRARIALAAPDIATSWRPFGLGDELRAALVIPSGCWG
jgi:hypothetical protein